MNNHNPLVSIIIPLYNREILVEETLKSIQNQTYENWEAIVIDDCSTDNSYQVVKNFSIADNKIQLFQRQRNPKGASTCRNIGLEKSKGKFVIFLDSDDLMTETCLERRISFFEKFPNEDFLIFQSLLFEKGLHDLNLVWNIDSKENDLERFLRIDALWPICGPIYKKEVLLKINGFREDLDFYQDFDLHLRLIMLKYKYKKYLDIAPDCFIRRHFEETTSNAIPFTSDHIILQKRINFYFSQLEFINKNNIHLSKHQRYTIWCILFYFCSCFLLEHNNKKKYYILWFKTFKLLKINLVRHTISFIFPILIHLQKRNKYFIKIKSFYHLLFKTYLADDRIIFNSTMYKISVNNSFQSYATH